MGERDGIGVVIWTCLEDVEEGKGEVGVVSGFSSSWGVIDGCDDDEWLILLISSLSLEDVLRRREGSFMVTTMKS